MTEVASLEAAWLRVRLWVELAMLASVFKWFIWLMAMETEAGARLAGIRGCDIIMKGRWSNPVGGDRK